MNVRPPTVHSNVILFISRSDQLFWRNRWTQGRFVKLAWTAEQRAEILRQDEIFRQADVEWERRHPKTTNAAMIVRFPRTGRGSACCLKTSDEKIETRTFVNGRMSTSPSGDGRQLRK